MCVNRKGVIKHSFLTKTVSLVILLLFFKSVEVRVLFDQKTPSTGGGGSRGPRSSWRSNRSFKVCVNRKGVMKHSFLTKTVSLVILLLFFKSVEVRVLFDKKKRPLQEN